MKKLLITDYATSNAFRVWVQNGLGFFGWVKSYTPYRIESTLDMRDAAKLEVQTVKDIIRYCLYVGIAYEVVRVQEVVSGEGE